MRRCCSTESKRATITTRSTRNLADVQTNKLEMPPSDAYREIVDRSIALVETSA